MNFTELDILPPFLHKTLASVSSPDFSEFSLRLFPGSDRSDSYGASGGWGTRNDRWKAKTWGDGWEVVDEDLYAHAVGRDDFRFTIGFEAGQSAGSETAVEAHFPRMKSKGSLVIVQRPRW